VFENLSELENNMKTTKYLSV